jgi:histone H3
MVVWPSKGPGFHKVICLGFLSTLSTDAAGKLDVLGHDGDTLGVDSAQVGVFEETDEVSLRSFLQSHDGGGLEAKISLEILSNLTHKTLEWQLADEELGTLLVTTDLTKSNSSGPVPVGLLDTTGSWCGLACSLGGKLLARSLSSSGFTSGLLSTGHLASERE